MICPAQSVGYVMPDRTKRVEIPFTYQNGFVVLRVYLQGFYPLKFIYDTGAETTIITDPRIAELLNLKYTRKFEIMGSDMLTPLTTYLIKGVGISFFEGAAPSQDVIVFDRDHFNLEEYVGDNVLGVLGADVFRNYIVTIDYKQERLILQTKNTFKPSDKYIALPMVVEKGKPYITSNLSISGKDTLSTKLLIDSGAAITLLLDADEERNLHLPEKTIKGLIGYGMGGEIEGYLGRIQSLNFHGIEFNNLVTNFRIFDANIDSVKVKKIDRKDGIIGNEVLKHFKCVFDLPNRMLYMRPYFKNYSRKVAFDRSGLGLIMVGKRFQQIMVSGVFENSPAEEAGFKKGDIIKSINGMPSSFLSYSGIVNKFKKKKDQKYRVKINRQGQVLRLEIRLRDLI